MKNIRNWTACIGSYHLRALPASRPQSCFPYHGAMFVLSMSGGAVFALPDNGGCLCFPYSCFRALYVGGRSLCSPNQGLLFVLSLSGGSVRAVLKRAAVRTLRERGRWHRSDRRSLIGQLGKVFCSSPLRAPGNRQRCRYRHWELPVRWSLADVCSVDFIGKMSAKKCNLFNARLSCSIIPRVQITQWLQLWTFTSWIWVDVEWFRTSTTNHISGRRNCFANPITMLGGN